VLGRRGFLAGGVASLGLGVAGGTLAAPAVRAQAAKTRIDVHHHFVPPEHREFLLKHNVKTAKWSVEMSLGDMDKSGIGTAVLSQVQPGPGSASRRKAAR
jgi:hypothetical protein